jgi:hypothetical protein
MAVRRAIERRTMDEVRSSESDSGPSPVDLFRFLEELGGMFKCI